jgi:hypothetical protein
MRGVLEQYQKELSPLLPVLRQAIGKTRDKNYMPCLRKKTRAL